MTVVVLWGMAILLALVVLDRVIAFFVQRKPAQLVFTQLLLVNAPGVQKAIHDIAVSGDVDQPGQLARMFLQAVQVTLDAQASWVYGRADVMTGKRGALEAQLKERAVLARAAFTSETTKNQQDGELRGATIAGSTATPEPGAPLYLAVTLGAVTARSSLSVPTSPCTDETVSTVLRHLMSLDSGRIHEVQVVWSPDVAGEFLTEEQAIRKYPDLGKL
ncbi:DUF1517 domain-containing protein [Deinococcus ficus]|uniref:DUF1517 domain-containing protein n=1 Tax=Deinococcus ficus TaxID=317577 RepID=UPI001747EA68|nr:DUF1517 domain-containing protein [Deinococcus ficus]GHF74217.1 hypothetical protein GCM10017782_09870 [Deinococcus ficus]